MTYNVFDGTLNLAQLQLNFRLMQRVKDTVSPNPNAINQEILFLLYSCY